MENSTIFICENEKEAFERSSKVLDLKIELISIGLKENGLVMYKVLHSKETSLFQLGFLAGKLFMKSQIF